MSRKQTKIDPKRAERVKKLIENEKSLHPDENITQKKIADRIGISQQNLSRIINQDHGLNESMAKLIVEAFSDRPPKKQYRLQWLLGFDDYMTDEIMLLSKQVDQLRKTDAMIETMRNLFSLSGFGTEWVDYPGGNNFATRELYICDDDGHEDACLPDSFLRDFGEEVCEYVNMRLKRIIKQANENEEEQFKCQK